MRVYDEVDAHRAELPGDVPRKAGGTHIGIFFAWCVERGLASDWHEREHAEEFDRLQRRWHSGRDYLLQFMDGKLTERHLGPAARDFAAAYYVSGDYRADYERTLRQQRPTIYHVPDTWDSVDQLAPVLDERFDTWRQARGKAPEAPVAAPPTQPAAARGPSGVGAPEERTPARARGSERDSDFDPAFEPELEPPPPDPLGADAALAPEPPRVQAEPASDPAPAPAFEIESSAPPWKRQPPAVERLPEPNPPTTRTTPPFKAPHRTKKAWHASKKGGGWVLILVIALIYGCVSLTQARSKRKDKRRAERDRIMRDARERHDRLVRDARRRARSTQPRRPQPQPALEVPRPPRKAPWPHVGPMQRGAAARAGVPVRFENEIGMRFVLIPAGGFVMGSSVGEPGRHEGEVPHNVLISKPFYLSITEVTNDQYRRFRRLHKSDTPRGLPSFDQGSMPATSVGWESAAAFCEWLGTKYAKSKRTYRLPTEAEWEYACRAGTAWAFWWGQELVHSGAIENLADRAARRGWPESTRRAAEATPGWQWFPAEDACPGMARVARYKHNPWGLYDMLGNASEWVADWAAPYDVADLRDPQGPVTGALKIFRGGAFDTPVRESRAAYRGGERPIRSSMNLGFRVVSPVPGR